MQHDPSPPFTPPSLTLPPSPHSSTLHAPSVSSPQYSHPSGLPSSFIPLSTPTSRQLEESEAKKKFDDQLKRVRDPSRTLPFGDPSTDSMGGQWPQRRDAILMCGYLKKKSPSIGWDRRYFTLDKRVLTYFKQQGDKFPLGFISLKEILTIEWLGEGVSGGTRIDIVVVGRKYKLQTDTLESAREWTIHLQHCVQMNRESGLAGPVDEDANHRPLHQRKRSASVSTPRTPAALRSFGWSHAVLKDAHRNSVTGEVEHADINYLNAGYFDSFYAEPSSTQVAHSPSSAITELQRSFFALKFSLSPKSIEVLSNVRSNSEILKFLLELELDTAEFRSKPLGTPTEGREKKAKGKGKGMEENKKASPELIPLQAPSVMASTTLPASIPLSSESSSSSTSARSSASSSLPIKAHIHCEDGSTESLIRQPSGTAAPSVSSSQPSANPSASTSISEGPIGLERATSAAFTNARPVVSMTTEETEESASPPMMKRAQTIGIAHHHQRAKSAHHSMRDMAKHRRNLSINLAHLEEAKRLSQFIVRGSRSNSVNKPFQDDSLSSLASLAAGDRSQMAEDHPRKGSQLTMVRENAAESLMSPANHGASSIPPTVAEFDEDYSRIAARLTTIVDVITSCSHLVVSLPAEDKTVIINWLLSEKGEQCINSVFSFPDALSHDRALRVRWLSLNLKCRRNPSKISIGREEIEDLISEKFLMWFSKWCAHNGDGPGSNILTGGNDDAPTRGGLTPMSSSLNSSPILQVFHNLLTMLISPIQNNILFSQPTLSSYSFTTSSSSSFIFNPGLWPAVLRCLHQSEFFMRKRALKDILSLFHRSPWNVASLLGVKEWQKELMALMSDLPKSLIMRSGERKERLSNVGDEKIDAVGSQASSRLLEKIYEGVLNVFNVIHFHCFIARGTVKTEKEQQRSATPNSALPSTSSPSLYNSLPPFVPSFPHVINPSLFLSSLSSPHDQEIPRAFLLSLILKLLHYPSLFKWELNDGREDIYDLTQNVKWGRQHRLHGRSSSVTDEADITSSPADQRSHPSVEMDSRMYCNLLHLLTLIKSFIFAPNRFLQLLHSTSSSTLSSPVINDFSTVNEWTIHAASFAAPAKSTKAAEKEKERERGTIANVFKEEKEREKGDVKEEEKRSSPVIGDSLLDLDEPISADPDPSDGLASVSFRRHSTARHRTTNSMSMSSLSSSSSSSLPSSTCLVDISRIRDVYIPPIYMLPEVKSLYCVQGNLYRTLNTLASKDTQMAVLSRVGSASGRSSPTPRTDGPLNVNIIDWPPTLDFHSACHPQTQNNIKAMREKEKGNDKEKDDDIEEVIGSGLKNLDILYSCHWDDQRGLKGDLELLEQTTKLLTLLGEDNWSLQAVPLIEDVTAEGGRDIGNSAAANPSGASGGPVPVRRIGSFFGGTRDSSSPPPLLQSVQSINDRLAAELSFFQDATVFLAMLAPLYGSVKSVITEYETSEIIEQFLMAKNSDKRKKVFRTYETKYKQREKQQLQWAEKRSRAIDNHLAAEASREAKVSKVLLLGGAESGKSTILKQCKQSFGEGFSSTERTSYFIIIFINLIRAIKSLVFHSDRLLTRFPFSMLSNASCASSTTVKEDKGPSKKYMQLFDIASLWDFKLNVAGKPIPQPLPSKTKQGKSSLEVVLEVLTHCNNLYGDLGIRVTLENRSHFDRYQLFDSDGYFLNKLAEIMSAIHPSASSCYVPSNEDCIRCRLRTTGLVEYDFSLEGQQFKLLDVAGQRSERKRWIPYFNDASGVVFVAAISEYDQVMTEDGKTNRLHEAIALFAEIINSRWFLNVPVVLFLNKRDIFEEKIKRVPLTFCFPKYRGGMHYDEATKYIKKQFLNKRSGEFKEKKVNVHFVSAIDMNLVKLAMRSVKEVLIKQTLQAVGLT